MQDTSWSGRTGDAIALAGVNLSLGRGAGRVHILKDIDLHIGRGEAIGLIGPSGSGKSTLLMVMAGLERADAGTVVIAGRTLGDAGRTLRAGEQRRSAAGARTRTSLGTTRSSARASLCASRRSDLPPSPAS